MRSQQIIQHLDEDFEAFRDIAIPCHFELYLAASQFLHRYRQQTGKLQNIGVIKQETVTQAFSSIRTLWVNDITINNGDNRFHFGTASAADFSWLDVFEETFNGWCLWWLVRLQEAYERLVRSLYADLVLANPSIGYENDFTLKNERPIDLAVQNRAWFQEHVKNIRKLQDVLKRMRKKIGAISTHEKANSLNRNFQLEISLFELLRHQIVHCHGTIPIDFEDFVKRKIGVDKGRSIKIPTRMIDGRRMIWLLNLEVKTCKNPDVLISSLKRIELTILSHASMLYKLSLNEHQSIPRWERPLDNPA